MADEPFSPKNEALRALNTEFKNSRNEWRRIECLTFIAIIDLLAKLHDTMAARSELKTRNR